MNANNVVTSLIRTIVPIAVGAVLAWAVRQGIPASDSLRGPLTEGLTFVFGAAYYGGVRLAEHKWPKLGWLLGKPVMPAYPAALKPGIYSPTPGDNVVPHGPTITTVMTGGATGSVDHVNTPTQPMQAADKPPGSA